MLCSPLLSLSLSSCLLLAQVISNLSVKNQYPISSIVWNFSNRSGDALLLRMTETLASASLLAIRWDSAPREVRVNNNNNNNNMRERERQRETEREERRA